MSPRSAPDHAFLPTTAAETGGEPLDVVLVTGDAFVDHPAFGAAVIGRWLQAHGFSVGILAQPDWRDPATFQLFGRPRLFFGVTAGNMDSMVNAFTSLGRLRNDDAFTPGGRAGARPQRATIAYTGLARAAFPGVPVVIGGIEASLRRLAHYDFWQDRIRGSILLDSKADLLVHGMGERAALEIARRLARGASIRDCRDIPGVAWAAGARETRPENCRALPSLEECIRDPLAFNAATLAMYEEARPTARPLLQPHGDRAIVVNPMAEPLDPAELDRLHALPFPRRPHPSYTEPIPAFASVASSLTVHRGCAGGCTFCALGLHQGRHIVSRTPDSVLDEVRALVATPGWTGTISDLGGATANMYGTGCRSAEARATCRRTSCLTPSRCRHFDATGRPYRDLLRQVGAAPGVRHVYVGSGLRHDLANLEPDLLADVLASHVSGRLTVAPEHVSDEVLRAMGKPRVQEFDRFLQHFHGGCRRAGREIVLVPYFLAAHPGTRPEDAIALALYQREHDLKPRQAQVFLPTPGTLATAMYVSGRDPRTGQEVAVPRGVRERSRHRALLYWWKREEAPAVREALLAWGRGDLIGHRTSCLVPPGPVRGGWLPRPEERRGVRCDEP